MIYADIPLPMKKEKDISTSGSIRDEKRLFCRMPVAAELTYSLPGTSDTCAGTCRNLSHSGIQFETDNRLQEGTSLGITIDTKSVKFKPMNVTVEVLRVEEAGDRNYLVAGRILEYK